MKRLATLSDARYERSRDCPGGPCPRRGHMDWRGRDGHDRDFAYGPPCANADRGPGAIGSRGAALTLLVAASGFYMVERLDLWDRFRDIEFWWMHAMVLLWLIFTFVLFIGEPLAARTHRKHGSQPASKGRLSFMQWLHWVLLLLSAITVLAAVAGSQGMSLVP